MAAVELPDGVVPREMEQRFLDAGIWQRGPLGGASVRIDRPGSRFAVAFQFPPLPSADIGRLVIARLIQASRLGLRIRLPLGSFRPGNPGLPVVDGDGQAGTSLAVRGFTPHYPVVEGQWLTHIRGDDALVYNTAAPTNADANGDAVLTLAPPLRIEPQDGDVLLFRQPVMQGTLVGDERLWRMDIAQLTSFELELEEMV